MDDSFPVLTGFAPLPCWLKKGCATVSPIQESPEDPEQNNTLPQTLLFSEDLPCTTSWSVGFVPNISQLDLQIPSTFVPVPESTPHSGAGQPWSREARPIRFARES